MVLQQEDAPTVHLEVIRYLHFIHRDMQSLLYRLFEPRYLICKTKGDIFPKYLHDGTYSLVYDAAPDQSSDSSQHVSTKFRGTEIFKSDPFIKFYNATFKIKNGIASIISVIPDGRPVSPICPGVRQLSAG